MVGHWEKETASASLESGAESAENEVDGDEHGTVHGLVSAVLFGSNLTNLTDQSSS